MITQPYFEHRKLSLYLDSESRSKTVTNWTGNQSIVINAGKFITSHSAASSWRVADKKIIISKSGRFGILFDVGISGNVSNSINTPGANLLIRVTRNDSQVLAEISSSYNNSNSVGFLRIPFVDTFREHAPTTPFSTPTNSSLILNGRFVFSDSIELQEGDSLHLELSTTTQNAGDFQYPGYDLNFLDVKIVVDPLT